jgi:long-subunit acyl-CoA synthetase (AMP-forming)
MGQSGRYVWIKYGKIEISECFVHFLDTLRLNKSKSKAHLITDLQIDSMTVAYSAHKLNGIISSANVAYTAPELEHQMRSSGVKAIFTCVPQLDITLLVAASLGIPTKHIYIMDLPLEITGGKKVVHKSVDDLVKIGEKLRAVEPLKWKKGQGAKQVAFLCYSSGTSGLPVRILSKIWEFSLNHTRKGLCSHTRVSSTLS